MPEIPIQVWSLIGVFLGFSLGEGSRWIRERLRIRKLKRVVHTELKAIIAQIDDKENILRQAIKALKEKKVLPMTAVRCITIGYGAYIVDLYEHYSDVDRNCLHIIYERLRVADSLTESFFEDFQRAIKDKILDEPWKDYIIYLNDLVESYKVVRSLISSFLVGKAVDVFNITSKKNGS